MVELIVKDAKELVAGAVDFFKNNESTNETQTGVSFAGRSEEFKAEYIERVKEDFKAAGMEVETMPVGQDSCVLQVRKIEDKNLKEKALESIYKLMPKGECTMTNEQIRRFCEAVEKQNVPCATLPEGAEMTFHNKVSEGKLPSHMRLIDNNNLEIDVDFAIDGEKYQGVFKGKLESWSLEIK